ncbi:MAG: efflux RND transporter permease subunit [Bacteriovoracaceae bacterium]|nr:efflux RND transporter permease subunit [Bacteriovoracaceae bacterium]
MNNNANHQNKITSLAQLSIERPVFITSIVILIILLGVMSFSKIPVNLFPEVNFPYVLVEVIYPGAGPNEVELNVSRPIEEELSNVAGLKSIRSVSRDGSSTVICQFSLKTDVKYAEQLIRDRMPSVKRKLPTDIKEPVIRRINPADLPVASVAVEYGNYPVGKAFDVTNDFIKVRLEQVEGAGLIEILGARKREIKVNLDQVKLKNYEISATQVVSQLKLSGQNIPAGKINSVNSINSINSNSDTKEKIYRTLGEFQKLSDIEKTIVTFYGNDKPVTVSDLGEVEDGLEDEVNRAYVNGKRAILIEVYKQSGDNTISVVKSVEKSLLSINESLQKQQLPMQVSMVRDGSREINANVTDVKESIVIGILLTIVVVFLFLRNFRSTFITSMALPNSLLGAFILLIAAGFTINVMTLLALSLSVGLLIDDAIVVRENIFRHMEMGKDAKTASLVGTAEVFLAVMATTLTVLAVFGPIAFLDGVVGQFFKEFGLTICFAMIISTFDALTIAPMLSTYLAKASKTKQTEHSLVAGNIDGHVDGDVEVEDKSLSQTKLGRLYLSMLNWSVKNSWKTVSLAILIFCLSIFTVLYVPKTFLPPAENGEFVISLELPAGTTLEEMGRVSTQVYESELKRSEIALSSLTVGNKNGESNRSEFYVRLVARRDRKYSTTQFKELIRQSLNKNFASAKPLVKDYDPIGGGERPFMLNVSGEDQEQLNQIGARVYSYLEKQGMLSDFDISVKVGKPEWQFIPLKSKAQDFGVTTLGLGMELRTLMEGSEAAIFRESGKEYDIRVRLQEDQRDIIKGYDQTYVPNINGRPIPISKVVEKKLTTSTDTILRQNRTRYINVGADIRPGGSGMGGAIEAVNEYFSKVEKLPPGYRYEFIGQAEDFAEMLGNMLKALLLAVTFIYLVLASLYDSFVIPLTIMTVLPLAACGAFFALYLTGSSVDIYSLIGLVMLLGVATKNSIILVDYAHQQVQKGIDLKEAILMAGRKRVRPILMTSLCLIAGMIPVAIGLNEASGQRTSMGIAIIGGVISSTLLTLFVVPATYSHFEKFRQLSLRFFKGEWKRKNR